MSDLKITTRSLRSRLRLVPDRPRGWCPGRSLLAPSIERALGRARALLVAVLGSALFTAGPALFTTVVPNVAVLVVGGVLMVVWHVITVSLRQRIVPEHLMGRVNAGYRLVAWGMMPLGGGHLLSTQGGGYQGAKKGSP